MTKAKVKATSNTIKIIEFKNSITLFKYTKILLGEKKLNIRDYYYSNLIM